MAGDEDKVQNGKILSEVDKPEWGELAENNFGYDSDEERRAKRGMEDWELVEKISESQKGIPFWFVGVIVTVLLVAVGLSFPFWGNRPGYEREWVDWGFVAALFYISAAGAMVYFMVQLYGTSSGGRLDSDKEKTDEQNEQK
ncbi:MAG: hypothetical protein HY306_00835 [Nitrosomonadales bacterium]|nr:hypothetical protein [Nitrosomonadales bacterium]